MNSESLGVIFRALANEDRLHIIKMLQTHEALNVSQVQHRLMLEQSTVSHHLKLLADAKLIKATRQGRFRLYSLNYQGIKAVADLIVNWIPPQKQ